MWNTNRSKSLVTDAQSKIPAEAEVKQEFSSQFLDQVKDLMGVSTVSDANGTIITIPTSENAYTQEFAEYFTNSNVTPVYNDTIENSRMEMYDMYDQMELYVPECAITLNTYRDEILGTGFVDKPFTIWSSDRKCQQYIERIFKLNQIEEKFASYVKALLKYGDIGFLFHAPLGATSYDPNDLRIEFIRPKDFRIYAEGSTEYQYDVGSVYKPLSKLVEDMYDTEVKDTQLLRAELQRALTKLPDKHKCTAWDFCHWSVYDVDYSPYGRSVLDSMRTLADQKSTMEVLMALGRASKIERILLEVTAPSNNPTIAMSQVQKTANTWKNMIMGADGLGGKNRNNTMGMTDVLTIPKDIVKVSKLSSSLDIAGTQDVEYFRDELITLSRIQKSSFMADQSINRGSTLEAQDLRFARAMTPFAKSVDTGVNDLAIQVALLGGFDLTKIAIKVTTNRPAYVTKEYLQTYEQLANSAANLLNKAGVTPTSPEYNDKYRSLLRELGMPESYISLMKTDYVPNEGEVNLTQTDMGSDTGLGGMYDGSEESTNSEDTYDSSFDESRYGQCAYKHLGSKEFIVEQFNSWKKDVYKPVASSLKESSKNESRTVKKVNHKSKRKS